MQRDLVLDTYHHINPDIMATRVQVKEVKQITFTNNEVIDATGLGTVSLEGLSKQTRQLNLKSSIPSFTAENIQHLTHLYLEAFTPQMEIPETLEHLLIYNQRQGPWPIAKRLYIEELDLEAFLNQETRVCFCVFSRMGGVEDRYLDKARSKYTVGPEQVLHAFGNTYKYHKLTLKPEPVPAPETPSTTAPPTRLTSEELKSLNTQNLASHYRNLPQEIYDEAHAACLKGEGWLFKKTLRYHTKEETNTVHQFLESELPGFKIESEQLRVMVTL